MLTKVSGGTDVKITQEGIPDVIPLNMCYLGWQDSLNKLIKLVEADIQEIQKIGLSQMDGLIF